MCKTGAFPRKTSEKHPSPLSLKKVFFRDSEKRRFWGIATVYYISDIAVKRINRQIAGTGSCSRKSPKQVIREAIEYTPTRIALRRAMMDERTSIRRDIQISNVSLA